MNLSIEGEEANGKTTMAYTGPLPIVGFSFDLGADRALYGSRFDEFFKDLKIEMVKYKNGAAIPKGPDIWGGNDITIFELPRPIQLDEDRVRGCMELWAYFISLYADAINDQAVRSIVIDTMTLARRIRAESHLQWLQQKDPTTPRKQLIQIEYGPTNDAIRNIYEIAKGTEKNLIALHHLTDEYEPIPGKSDTRQTGRRVLEGLNGTYRYVDIAMRLEKNKGAIVGKMEKCGYNLSLEGLPYNNPTWDSVVDSVNLSLNGRIKLEKRNP